MKKKWSFTVVLLGSILTLVYSWNQNKPSQSSTLKNTSHVTRTPASQAQLPVKRHAHFHPDRRETAKTKDEIKSVEQMTTSLILLKKNYLAAKSEQKDNIKRQMIDQAQLRNTKLLSLVKTNPQDLIKMAIPVEKSNDFPKEVLALIETPIKVKGKVESLYEDYEDGSHQLRQYLKAGEKKPFELHFVKTSTNLPVNQNIQANGIFIPDTSSELENGHIALESQEKNIMTLAADGTGEPQVDGSIVLEAPSTIGEKSLLVIMVNFQDDPDNKPWTIDQINKLVFEDTNNYYKEASLGQTSLAGDTVGYFTLSTTSITCSYWEMASEARALAEASGVILSNYNLTMLMFPKNSGCSWSGLGTIGSGTSGQTWINGSARVYLFAHELGHNFGLWHARAAECGDKVVMDSGCAYYTYGDDFDMMGGYPGAHFNSFHKKQLSWLDPNNPSNILTIQESGTYTMGVHAFPTPEHPAALRVLRTSDETTGEKDWYYMEYRQPVGFDNTLANYPHITDGVLFHTGSDIDRNSSNLLDMTPASSTWYDFDDASLGVGNTYIDEAAGVEITVDGATDTNATVTITLGPRPCVAKAPSLVVESSQSIWAPAGESATYQLKLTNNDSANCDPSLISLSTSPPDTWTADLSQVDVQLAPGESVSFSTNVLSASDAVDGFYTTKVLAQHGDLTTNADLTYVVDNPVIIVNSPPVAVGDSATTMENQAVVINVLANDSDPDGDILAISSFDIASGSAKVNSDGTITFTPATGFFGVTSFGYTIEDGKGGSASAKVSVTVNELPDITKPTVVILTPTNNSSVTGGEIVNITTDIKDNKGIKRADLYINGVLLGSDTSAPYNFSYTIPTQGKYKDFTIEVRAFDTSNNSANASVFVSKSGAESTSSSGPGKGNGRKK